ncbi:MAG: type II and III secretion system protein family protein [Pseudomonadota bacterium]
MKFTMRKLMMATALGVAGLMITGLGPQEAPFAAPNVLAADGQQHKSMLQLADHELPSQRAIKIARDKSVMIELPRALRDVVVSNPEIVDAVVQASNRVYLIAKKTGQANAFFFDASGERVLTLEISVDQDTAPLASMLKRLIPDSDITVEMLNDTVILSGTVMRPSDAVRARNIASRFAVVEGGVGDSVANKKVVNLINVLGKEQVMLRVTVAEMNRQVFKRLGVNLSAQALSNGALQFATGNAFPLTQQFGTSGALVGTVGNGATNCLTAPTTQIAALPTGTPSAGLNCLQQSVEAFERNGLIRTLAEPSLVAISGETASFLAGGEFPVPVGQDNGTVAIEFKPFGVGLSFTPFVQSENRISLKINTEVSEIDDTRAVSIGLFGIPGLSVRRATTTVELPSGGSMVLAGLIKDDTRQNIEGFPGLKDLPVLGTLFRSRDFQQAETELVVIVTPIMVKPVGRNQLARPDDNWLPASDRKANFLGHMNRIYGREEHLPTEAEASMKDDVGFIIE